jgi:hypothetical protein
MATRKVTTTLSVYAHLFDDYHAAAMTARGAMVSGHTNAGNVVSLWGWPSSSKRASTSAILATMF